MGEIFPFLMIVVIMGICVVLVSIIARVKAEFDGNKAAPKHNAGKTRGYNREVDAIHLTTDASSERTRRLDQLKSLYESGMMERDEYLERCASVEEDFRRGYRR